MSGAAYDPPPSPPPPSYEISQHEFDQKTSHVLEQSASDPPPRRVDDDGFEVWDDAIFEAALAGVNDLSLGQPSHSRQPSGSFSKASQAPSQLNSAYSSGSASASTSSPASSSSAAPPPFTPSPHYGNGYPQEKGRARPVSGSDAGGASVSGSSSGSIASPAPSSPPQAVRPLRVTKRARPTKERPSWYAEAGLGGESPPASSLSSQASSSSTSTSEDRPLRRQLTVFNVGDREGTPPPEFSAVGPSLDGPPYDAVIMTYNGPAPPSARNTPEPPAFSALHPPATVDTPQPRSSPAPINRSGSARPHLPVHAQSLPQRPLAASPRPQPVHQQHSMPPTTSMSSLRDSAAGFRASAYGIGGKAPSGPRLSFNPQMAYSKTMAPTIPTRTEETGSNVADPSAFYSGAVSAHYSFNVPTRVRRQSEVPSLVQHAPAASTVSLHSSYASSVISTTSDQSIAPVASPRPSYAYGQAKFQEPSYNPGGAWGYAAPQQGWPSGGSSHSVYR